ncbi:MAG: 50S ribosomal protein L9 [Planctomycetota bacterium]
MPATIDLLLTENVDNLGIVGDIVKVKAGYARNYLLPRSLATFPSQELIDQLADRRREAEAQLAALRTKQAGLVEQLEGYELRIERSCNDQGQLYGSVTQKDIADALNEAGYGVQMRDVRLGTPAKRVGHYDVPIKFTPELECTIDVSVAPDRPLNVEDESDEPGIEFDDDGNPIEPVADSSSTENEEATQDAEKEAAAAE